MIIGDLRLYSFICDGCGKEGIGSFSQTGPKLPEGWHAELLEQDNLGQLMAIASGKANQEALFRGKHFCEDCQNIKDIIE